jgi:hypothetical protein
LRNFTEFWRIFLVKRKNQISTHLMLRYNIIQQLLPNACQNWETVIGSIFKLAKRFAEFYGILKNFSCQRKNQKSTHLMLSYNIIQQLLPNACQSWEKVIGSIFRKAKRFAEFYGILKNFSCWKKNSEINSLDAQLQYYSTIIA